MAFVSTFRSQGRRLPYTPVSLTSSGTVVIVGAIVGIATEDIAAGETGSLAVEGVFECPLLAGDSPTPKVGDTVYWDSSASAASVQSTYTHIMGLCWNDGTQASGNILVNLSPFLAASGAYGP